jgi:protein tyrosine/serine phosphatase
MLTGVTNFRDFGGYRVGDGHRIKRGRLYRSARPALATEADQAIIHGLGLSAIVDLRRGSERRGHPTGDWSARYEMIVSDLGGDDDPWPARLRASGGTAEEIRAYLFEFYRTAPFEDRHIDLFSRYFRTLAAIDGAVLVHCAGGKDRTGIAVALTHTLLGVDPADIMSDFLLTNRLWSYDDHGAAVSRAMSEEAGRPLDEPAVRAAMELLPDYLDTALDAISERSGSVDAYLRDVLNVDAAIRSAILERLVEPV